MVEWITSNWDVLGLLFTNIAALFKTPPKIRVKKEL